MLYSLFLWDPQCQSEDFPKILNELPCAIRVALLTYKHKTHVINNDGSVLSNADVDFYIDDVSLFRSFTLPVTFHSKVGH